MLRFFRREPSNNADKERIQQAIQPTKSTWFGRVAALFQAEELSAGIWDELEEALISSDVGVETAEGLIFRTRERVLAMASPRPSDARQALKEEMVWLLDHNWPEPEVPTPPMVILMVGVNGAGKTTTIGKLAHLYRKGGKRVMLAAADTFRAAAVEQLQAWGRRSDAEVIAHGQGADPGAVAFDTVQAGRSRGMDVVLIDTAGRLQTKVNLMEEIKKVRRVIQRVDPTAPHEVYLVMDATTGQNGLSQAHHFTEAVDVSGVILTKLDGTAKGGIALAIAEKLALPVVYVGTGETIDDLVAFDPAAYVDALFA
ncbi:MAG: signal recognition particle-docking protein FtsY [Chloroflexota bacterium]